MTNPHTTQRHHRQYKHNKYTYRSDYPVDQRHRNTLKIPRVLTVYAVSKVGHEKGPFPEEDKGREQYEKEGGIDNKVHGFDEGSLP